MAYQLNYFAESITGCDDFSTTTGPCFVSMDSTGRGVFCPAGTRPEGILENAPPLGNVLSVSYLGITKMTVDAAYPIGTFLKSNGTLGIAMSTAAADTTTARAITLEDSTAANDIVTVRLLDR